MPEGASIPEMHTRRAGCDGPPKITPAAEGRGDALSNPHRLPAGYSAPQGASVLCLGHQGAGYLQARKAIWRSVVPRLGEDRPPRGIPGSKKNKER